MAVSRRKIDQEQEAMLVEIEERSTIPTNAEWVGILHEIVMDDEAPTSRRIRALAQMDRITGDPGDLTEQAIRDYIQCLPIRRGDF